MIDLEKVKPETKAFPALHEVFKSASIVMRLLLLSLCILSLTALNRMITLIDSRDKGSEISLVLRHWLCNNELYVSHLQPTCTRNRIVVGS